MPRLPQPHKRFVCLITFTLILAALLAPGFGGAGAQSIVPATALLSAEQSQHAAVGPRKTSHTSKGTYTDSAFALSGTAQSAPRVDSLSPSAVTRSGLLRIAGAHFGAAKGASQLKIDGREPTYIASWADDLIIAYIPEQTALGAVPVTLTMGTGTATSSVNVTARQGDGRIRWRFTVAANHVPRRAAVGPDGTAYVNDVLGRLYAIAPDGGLKWVLQAGLVGGSNPVTVGADGTVYVVGFVPANPATPCETSPVNVEGIFAVNPDGTQKWLYDKTCGPLLSGPNVGPDGNIHAVADTGIGAFALKPDGTLAHAPTGRFGVDGSHGTEIVFGPAAPGQAPTQKYFQYESGGLFGYTLDGQRVFLHELNAVGITQPVAGQRTGTVYTSTDQQTSGRFFAVSPQGALRWVSSTLPLSKFSIPDAPPSESGVYVVQNGSRLHRFSPADGSIVWTFIDNFDELLYPVVSPDDRLVLVGGRANYDQPGFFEAVSTDGSQLWKQYLPNEPGFEPYGQVRATFRARFTADGQTAYIAADISGSNRVDSHLSHSFFYALDTSAADVPINQPPSVSLVSPLEGSNHTKNTPVEVRAQVTDDGPVARVEFYRNLRGVTQHVGTDTAPDASGVYSIQFTPSLPDTYGLFAVAYDAGGLSRQSNLVTIWVSNELPRVSWVSPADGASYPAGAAITLTARASDPDGTVAKVEFSSTLTGDIGTDTTADSDGTYSVVYSGAPAGTHELYAWATDNDGDRRAAFITMTVAAEAPPPTPTPTPTPTPAPAPTPMPTPTPTPTPGARVNVALAGNGGVVTVSSTTTQPGMSFPASSLNDGDRRGLNWEQGGGWRDGTDSFPDWVQIDFAGARSISEVSVLTIQDAYSSPQEPVEDQTFSLYGVTAFDVEYWDGSRWAAVPGGSVTGSNKVWRKISFPTVTTDRIRVVIQGAMAGRSRLIEVEAWTGSVGAPPPPTPTPTPTPTPAPRANAALASNGGVVSVSSTTSLWEAPGMSFPASSLNDGDRRGLNWEQGGGWRDGTDSFPDWMQVDFSEQKLIDEINVFTIQDAYTSSSEPTETQTFSLYGITAFHVQYWDGSSWMTVPNGSVTGNNKVWRKFTFSEVRTSAIRVVINNALAGRSRVIEVEAWGPTFTQPPPPSQRLNAAAAVNGGVVTASSTTSQAEAPGMSFPASSLNDGDRRGLNWEQGGGWRDGTDSFPDWVQIDFAGARSISEVSVLTIQDAYSSPQEPVEDQTFSLYGVTAFDVEYWDGSRWAAVPGGSVTGSNKVWRKISFPTVTTDKVRVVIRHALAGRSRLIEIEAWTP